MRRCGTLKRTAQAARAGRMEKLTLREYAQGARIVRQQFGLAVYGAAPVVIELALIAAVGHWIARHVFHVL